MFQAGEIISIKWHMGIQHDGIYTCRDTVIAASKRTGVVQEESLEDFSGGRKIRSKGYPSHLPFYIIEQNARAKIGKRYNLFGYNCQHFASQCHGKKQSRQLRVVAASVASIAVTALLTRGRIFRI